MLRLVWLVSFCFIACAEAASPRAHAEPVPSESALAAGETCGQVRLKTKILKYCYRDSSGQARQPGEEARVVYFFHGLGGNEHDLFTPDSDNLMRLLTIAYGQQTPILASLSIGSQGVYTTNAREILDGLKEVERTIAPKKKLKRILVGGSMGGHNALRLLAESPKSFVALAALCPALATFNGFNQNEVDAYIARHRLVMGDANFFRRALEIYKREIRTPEGWVANNPFTFLDRGVYDEVPIFISVGREDTLGFVEGAREFKRHGDLRPRGLVDYHEFRGPHCTFDPVAFVRFLSRVSN